MLKNLAPLFYTAAGVVAAGAAGYAVVETTSPETPPQALVSPASQEVLATSKSGAVIVKKSDKNTKAEEQELAKLVVEEDAKTDTPVKEKAEIRLPGFDVLRVEQDGSTVIAGTAPANSFIQIVDAANGNAVVGTATALRSGDYAIVLEKPLTPGKHELYIISTLKGGEKIQSADAGLIEVPASLDAGEPIVIVSTPGLPTRVLQTPQVEVAALPEVKAEEPEAVEEKSIITATVDKPDVEPEVKAEEAIEKEAVAAELAYVLETNEEKTEVSELVEDKNPITPAVPAVNVQPVLIQAADVEDSKIFIAGVGEPGTIINMYLGEVFLGFTKVADNGAFLFEGDHQLEPGRYPVRADMLITGSSDVLARAEVNLVHQPKIDLAKTAPAVEPEKAIEEVAKQEPEKEPEVATVETTVAALKAKPEPEVNVVEKEPEAPVQEQVVNVDTKPEEAPKKLANVETKPIEAPEKLAEAKIVLEELPEPEKEITSTVTQKESPAIAEAVEVDEIKPAVETVEVAAIAETEVEASEVSESAIVDESAELEEVAEVEASEANGLPEIRTGAAVIIRRGDSLWRVARRNYGAGVRFTTIFDANRDQVRDPHLIYPGQVLKVPVKAQSEAGTEVESDAG